MKAFVALLVLVALLAPLAASQADGPRLPEFEYPFPVRTYALKSQQQNLEMAYMDLAPTASARAPTVVLLHGKNFGGAYWEKTAVALREAGYRVVIPDQIGFGKSSKPASYQFSFHQLASNTRALLQHLGIPQAHLVGHSMGGMIATRYALMFPEDTLTLTLVDPLGLEDWKAKGVPYTPIDRSYEQELKQTPEKIRAYQLENYYHGEWRPDYDRWVEYLAQFARTPDYARMAWNQALTSEMIYTQPVCHEFAALRMPVLLLIGELDRTAPGRNLAPPDKRAALGNYPQLARDAAAVIPQAQRVQLDGVGHLPHIEAFPRFIVPLKEFLADPSSKPSANRSP